MSGSLPPSTKSSSRWSFERKFMLGFVIVLAALWIVGSLMDSGSPSGSTSRPTPAAVATAEEDPLRKQLRLDGFSFHRDVAYRFLTDDEKRGRSCTYGSCVWVKTVALSGCRSLYVEANVLDKDGTIIDWTNATASNMRAGDEAILELSSRGGTTFRLTEMNCH